jgi:hypothetical protein
MIGQGRPLAVRLSLSIRLLITIFATLCLLPQFSLLGEEKDGARLRFTWGGGSDSVWRGKVEFPSDAKLSGLRILGLESEHAGRIYLTENTVYIDLVKKSMFGFAFTCTNKARSISEPVMSV